MLETWPRESGRAWFNSLPHFVFVDYVLILYDYQMAFSLICSAVYTLCFSALRNRCLLMPVLSILFGFPFVLACLVLACITLFYWLSLCSCRATVHVPFSYIGIPSSSCYRAFFFPDNSSGFSCHVRRFIGRSFACYSLNFL